MNKKAVFTTFEKHLEAENRAFIDSKSKQTDGTSRRMLAEISDNKGGSGPPSAPKVAQTDLSLVARKLLTEKESFLKLRSKIAGSHFSDKGNIGTISRTKPSSPETAKVQTDKSHPASPAFSPKNSSPKRYVPERILASDASHLRSQCGSQESRFRPFSKFSSSKLLTDRNFPPSIRITRSPQIKSGSPGLCLTKQDSSGFPPLRNHTNFERSCDTRLKINNFCGASFNSPQLSQKFMKSIVGRKENMSDASQQKHFSTFLVSGKKKIEGFGSSFLKKVSRNFLDRVDSHGDVNYLRSFQGGNTYGKAAPVNRPNVPDIKGSILKSMKDPLAGERGGINDSTQVESIACSKGLLGKILERQKNLALLHKSPVLCRGGLFGKVKASGSFDRKEEVETAQNFKKKQQMVSDYS
jgi:hypothetical protein